MTHHKSRLTSWGAIAALAASATFAGPALADACSQQFMFSGSIVNCTIETTGLYILTAFGAEGGSGAGNAGGLGARASGDFNLTMGEMLQILVGGMGGLSQFAAGGGGGGSFVVDSNNSPLLVAGGGGGAGTVGAGGPGQADNAGNRNGGAGNSGISGGGGGGGFSGDGGDGGSLGSSGGSSFTNGGGGGGGGLGVDYGGFGGGGGGGFGGAGGGSFVADFASNPQLLAGINSGNGHVLLELLEAPPTPGNDVPEPSSILLFGLALLGLGVGLRRRKRAL